MISYTDATTWITSLKVVFGLAKTVSQGTAAGGKRSAVLGAEHGKRKRPNHLAKLSQNKAFLGNDVSPRPPRAGAKEAGICGTDPRIRRKSQNLSMFVLIAMLCSCSTPKPTDQVGAMNIGIVKNISWEMEEGVSHDLAVGAKTIKWFSPGANVYIISALYDDGRKTSLIRLEDKSPGVVVMAVTEKDGELIVQVVNFSLVYGCEINGEFYLLVRDGPKNMHASVMLRMKNNMFVPAEKEAIDAFKSKGINTIRLFKYNKGDVIAECCLTDGGGG